MHAHTHGTVCASDLPSCPAARGGGRCSAPSYMHHVCRSCLPVPPCHGSGRSLILLAIRPSPLLLPFSQRRLYNECSKKVPDLSAVLTLLTRGANVNFIDNDDMIDSVSSFLHHVCVARTVCRSQTSYASV